MLFDELQKPEYENLSSTECFSILREKKEIVVSAIDGKKLKKLQVYISSWGLRKRLSNATESQAPFAAAIEEAIHPAYLAAENTFSIDLSDENVMLMLQGASSTGLLYESEVEALIELSKREKFVFENITLREVVSIKEPALVDVGNFIEIENVNSLNLIFILENKLPEFSVVRIETSYSFDGVNFSLWKTAGHIHSVLNPDIYQFKLPDVGAVLTKARFRGEFYKAVGVLKAV